jgi:hypothetical protein
MEERQLLRMKRGDVDPETITAQEETEVEEKD